VFFTDDLKLGGQFLNFSNLLTIGPTDYRGGVVTIDVDEVHLRGSTGHIKELLQKLSEEPDCPLGPHAPGERARCLRRRPVARTIRNGAVGAGGARRRQTAHVAVA
jgi:hypothetical protein